MSEIIDPSKRLNEKFELYSVPYYEYQRPEIVTGKEIGSTKQKIAENDILVCKINPRINRVWVTKSMTNHEKLGSSEWIVFRNHLLNPHYMRLYFTSPFFREVLLSNVSGVGGSLMRAQPDSVKKYPILLPPIVEQNSIVNTVLSLFNILDDIEKSLS